MSIGEILGQQRSRLGIDLENLSQNTRIRREYLEAIEADQPDRCPGRFFYRSFVRQYAEAVGLNPDEIEAGIPESPPAPEMEGRHASATKFPLRAPDRILSQSNQVQSSLARGKVWRPVAALILVIAACSVLYSRFAGHRTERGESIRKPAAATTSPRVAVPLPKTEPVAPAPEPVPDSVTVTVKATQHAWISLATEGEPAITATLEPGEAKTVAGKGLVRLRTGNAGGLEVNLNGKSLGTIGRTGQVLTVVFTPQGFRILEPSDEDGRRPEGPVDTAARLSRR